MKPTVENAKLLATLLGIVQSENKKVRDDLYEQIYSALQQDITNPSNETKIKYLVVEGIETPIPIQVFRGDKGEHGISGKDGRDGKDGVDGRDGKDGRDGATGPKGDPGERGEQGIQGERGIQGEQGIQGVQGEQGLQGIQGVAGKDGENGKDGAIGPAGEKGDRGEKGDKGDKGEQGDAGPKGDRGEKGEKGDSGEKGEKGDNGERGEKGERGDKGDPGEKGEQGETGPAGRDADTSEFEKKFQKTFDEFIRQVSSQITRMALQRDGSSGGGEVWLKFLNDVDVNSVSSPQNGQALVWNNSLKKWQANTIAGGGGNLNLLSISSSLIPSANNTYDLGSDAYRWNDLYLTGNTIYLGGTKISRNTDGSLRIANETSNALATIQVSAVNTTNPSNFANVTISNLVLSSVLKTNYGGTGLTSFTAKGVLYASNTSSLAFATGAQGKIFQAGSGGVPVFDDLDGGSF